MSHPRKALPPAQILCLLVAVTSLLLSCAESPSSRDSDVQAVKGGPTRLAVVGDFGSATADEYRIARRIKMWVKNTRVHGFVTTGDNIYPDGHPDSFDAAWHEPYGWVDRRNLTKVASIGNHDHHTDEGRPVMELLDMPHGWYKRHFRHVDVLILDSNRPESERQRRWLRRTLKNSTARWQVVAWHHPPFSCGAHPGDPEMRKAFSGIIRKHGGDLVLNGHEHSYQRFEKKHGVTYVVTGGGGAKLYDLGPCPDSGPRRVASNDQNHHYVRLFVRKDRIRIRAVSGGGKTIDRHSLTR